MEIRKLARHEEYENCVDLQKKVWGFSDRDALPSRTMLIAQRFGGCVLGAFDDGKLIGFVIALASYYADSFAQHSHMLAVSPEYQNQNIGWQLKLAQRREALARGIHVITWTFDPLESRNAHLNLNKLGAISRTYHENYYPANSSELYSGLGTDRLLAEWWIDSKRVRRLLDNKGAQEKGTHPPQALDSAGAQIQKAVTATSYTPEGMPLPSESNLNLSGPHLAIEIPAEVQTMRKVRPDLAKAWREATRAAFKHYVPRGYVVSKLIVTRETAAGADRHSLYFLERGDLQFLLS